MSISSVRANIENIWTIPHQQMNDHISNGNFVENTQHRTHDNYVIKKDDENGLNVGKEMRRDMIEKARSLLKGSKTELKVSVHEKTNRLLIQVIDSESRQIVKEIPSEKLLDLCAGMREIAGLFIDEGR